MEARELAPSAIAPFQLSLRIRHPSMDPAEISRELGVQAEHSFKAGEPRGTRAGRAGGSVHAESYWLGSLVPAAWSTDERFSGQQRLLEAQEGIDAAATRALDVALSVFAAGFLRNHAAFLRRVHAEGGQASLRVELTPEAVRSFTLSPHVCRPLSELGISVDFEFTDG